jgi:hypothetical protein
MAIGANKSDVRVVVRMVLMMLMGEASKKEHG